ncbi:MAG: PIN domain-containing protein [Actinomycetota bacterium]|nr:PIN domain-containing protein [Actinomycetota bacterium]
MTGEIAFLDTNVLVYTVDAAEPEKQARARELLRSPPVRGYAISAQVLSEFFSVATRRLGIAPADAREGVRRFVPLCRTAVDAELVRDAIELHVEASVSYWDALILAAAARLRCALVFSEDLGDGQVIGGVRVINPF